MSGFALQKKYKQFWHVYNSTIILSFLVAIFFFYAIFIALNLQTGIIPDEKTHFVVSKHFSTTLGIPPDVPETYTLGVYIKQNPFIYYWINGRIINIFMLIIPLINDWKLLVILRIINTFYSLGTIYFFYLLSKILIKSKWLQLFSVFLLTNTTMFVFLSGGLNYDNLINLLCMVGIYFFVRVLNHEDFVVNSLVWMICIAFSTLIKYTTLPLLLVMGFIWVTFYIKFNRTLFPINFKRKQVYALSVILIFIIFGIIAIYGYNLVVYQSIRPPCETILTEEQCNLSIFNLRLEQLGLGERLTISESKNLGYPGPIKYFFTIWLPFLISRTFGVLGHRYFFPVTAILMHISLFYLAVIVTAIYWREFSLINLCCLGIFLFYSLVLFLYNYNAELSEGFRNYSVQGRYLFPVIGLIYIFFTKVLVSISGKRFFVPSLAFTLVLYFINGPLIFVIYFDSVFRNWFIH